jgi:hypothetical protein
MKNISARDYDVFKTKLPFEENPTGSDFYISTDANGFSWSTNGETLGQGVSSITRATSAIKMWATANNKTGKVWLLDGTSRKYVGEIG